MLSILKKELRLLISYLYTIFKRWTFSKILHEKCQNFQSSFIKKYLAIIIHFMCALRMKRLSLSESSRKLDRFLKELSMNASACGVDAAAFRRSVDEAFPQISEFVQESNFF